MKKQLLLLFILTIAFSLAAVNSNAQLKDPEAQKAATENSGQRKTPEDRAAALANRLKDKLDLKESQIPKLKAIFTKQEKAIENYYEEMRKAQEKMMAELATVLDSLQLQKFKDMQGRHSAATPITPQTKKEADSPAPKPKK